MVDDSLGVWRVAGIEVEDIDWRSQVSLQMS
jgi:hypothetical protein